ncbi:MAG: MmcQ/YjbR family DNA-binding protein [Chloroflexota bacterium]
MNRDELIAYCLTKTGAFEDTPFGPDTLTIKVMNKLFALTGTEPDAKTVNLKCDPDHALFLRNVYPDDVKPGYHMNKQHWNTVTLAGAVSDDEIRDMVDESYDLVVKSLKKADREALKAMHSE